MKNRIGKLHVSEELMSPEYISDLSKLYQIFFPIYIENRTDDLRYYILTGYCKEFKEVDLLEGEQPPLYLATFTDNSVIID